MGEAPLAVAEHGALSGEVTKCLPPLFELELPFDGGGFVADATEVHRETPQRLAGAGAGVTCQMAGDVHLQVEDAALMRRFGPAAS